MLCELSITFSCSMFSRLNESYIRRLTIIDVLSVYHILITIQGSYFQCIYFGEKLSKVNMLYLKIQFIHFIIIIQEIRYSCASYQVEDYPFHNNYSGSQIFMCLLLGRRYQYTWVTNPFNGKAVGIPIILAVSFRQIFTLSIEPHLYDYLSLSRVVSTLLSFSNVGATGMTVLFRFTIT